MNETSRTNPITLTVAIMAILTITKNFHSSFGAIVTAIRAAVEQIADGRVSVTNCYNHNDEMIAVEAIIRDGSGVVCIVTFDVEVASGEALHLRIFRGGFEYVGGGEDKTAAVLSMLAQLATTDDIDEMMAAA